MRLLVQIFGAIRPPTVPPTDKRRHSMLGHLSPVELDETAMLA